MKMHFVERKETFDELLKHSAHLYTCGRMEVFAGKSIKHTKYRKNNLRLPSAYVHVSRKFLFDLISRLPVQVK